MSYPGGKSLSGVYQFIINQIPPHRVFIESHLGGGAIVKNKKPADINIGIDIDPLVFQKWSNKESITLVNADALEYLYQYKFEGDEFLYVDPPYLRSTRKTKRKIYNFEYDESQHIMLLDFLLNLKCKVMISGYFSELYNKKLENWRKIGFDTRNRAGTTVTEYLWMNYPEVRELHDYQYLGSTFRERERIKKRNLRWKYNIRSLPILERKALLEALIS